LAAYLFWPAHDDIPIAKVAYVVKTAVTIFLGIGLFFLLIWYRVYKKHGTYLLTIFLFVSPVFLIAEYVLFFKFIGIKLEHVAVFIPLLGWTALNAWLFVTSFKLRKLNLKFRSMSVYEQ
jgi:hypothetical protein